jgi:hypothetical protein
VFHGDSDFIQKLKIHHSVCKSIEIVNKKTRKIGTLFLAFLA